MPAMDSSFLVEFHNQAKAAGLDYLIIGGFAVSYWGSPRFTADVDYVIASNDLERAKEVVAKLGYKVEFIHPKQSFAHFTKIDLPTFRLDLMMVNDQTWAALKSDSSEGNFGGEALLPVVGPLHLIAMKLHAAKQLDREERFKDLNDIVEILIAQRIPFEELEKSGIIDKYGTEVTIARLRELYHSRQSS